MLAQHTYTLLIRKRFFLQHKLLFVRDDMRKIINKLLLLVTCLIFLSSCALFDKEAKKEPETTTPPKKTQKAPLPKTSTPSDETPIKPKATPKAPAETAPPASPEKQSQQTYYDSGMKYYSEEKYAEAKKAWQMVLKLGKKTKLANKARENIRKTDQILKTLEGLDNK
jgi:TolA-binding protein